MSVARRLDRKRVFVTGASRGIGRAIAEACAAEGAVVGVGFHRSAEKAEELARSLPSARAIALDVADPASVERAIGSFADEAGGLDAVVVNAAVHVAGLLATAETDALRRVVDTNVLGPLACARAALPRMLAQKRGLLLFVGSIASARPARGQAAYAATKASVEALARAIAVEYARKGIRALCMRPGAVATDMLAATTAMAEEEVLARILLRRVAEPAEIGRFAAFLLSDDAAYANGAVIDVDGGMGAG